MAVQITRAITKILGAALIPCLVGCVSTFDRDLAFHHAPVHYQDTDSSDAVSDYLTAVDYDGEWETKNNWDNLKTNSADLRAKVYYSVVESCTHWFVVYGFYHPRDWTDTPFDQEHENDLEGVLAIIRKDGIEFGSLQGVITVFHNDFFSYVPSGSSLVDGAEDIDGTLHFQTVGSMARFKTSQEAKGHGLKAWPAAGDFDGSTNQDGIIYFPVRSNAEVPSSGNDRSVNYELVDVFSGMWTLQLLDAQRLEANRTTFIRWGTFRGDESGSCGDGTPTCASHRAHAPWGWDDHGDGPTFHQLIAVSTVHIENQPGLPQPCTQGPCSAAVLTRPFGGGVSLRFQDRSTAMKPEVHDHHGRRIEIREHKDQTPELLIDGVRVAYGRLPDGSFYLHDYAYDWTNDLVDLARRYIDYRSRVAEVHAAAAPRKEK